jgi:hypothetical protein
MRTNSRRRDQGLALAVLTVVLSLPELAQAQQSGLFPLYPIKRQRVPCDQEDPTYKTYKYQYFGYHPTCWRPFPDGWGCPSRLAPTKADWEKSYKDIPPIGGAAPETGPTPGTGDVGAPGGPATRPTVPSPPADTRPSPFEDKSEDPFTTPAKPGTPPAQPRTSPPPAANPPMSENDVPDLSAPADQPRRSQVTRSATRDDDDRPAAGEAGDGPLLALPDINVPSVDGSSSATAANTPSNSATTGSSPPPRRGLISGFFSNLGWNWTRR